MRWWGGVVFALVLLGSVVAVLVISPVAFAQSLGPDAPTAVAVYSVESEKLEVRWSSSDASTTSFKVQWKSGSEEFDSSRQLSSDPATSIESEQSTSAGDRYKAVLTGLTDGTEYTVRVIAANANGDSDASGEATGTPQSTPGQSREFVENEVVEILESSFPWLRETWDYMTAQDAFVNFRLATGGSYSGGCTSPDDLVDSDLWRCDGWGIIVGRFDPHVIDVIIHELAHVYTLANDVASTPAPVGIAHLYFLALVSPDGREGPGSACNAIELYADGLLILTLGDGGRDPSRYWRQCSAADTATEQALAVLGSAATGQMPSWFADTYNDSVGDPDLVRVWADVKVLSGLERQRAIVYQLRDAFGGYCDDSKATESAFADGVTRNPWNDGGCVPEAPADVGATAVGTGKLAVSWQEPPDDGGSPISGYKVQWKSGTQDYSSSREALVTNLTDLRRTISGLTNDESHTLRVLAYNDNGDGAAAETTATPTATDTTAPTLSAATVDRATLRLTWNEALDASSEPASTAFTVNVGGVSRGIDEVSVLGNVVTLSLAPAVNASDTVTVGYSAPTGSGANPLKDSATNNASDFSGQEVRNDTTQVAITSDPGTDMTYIWGNWRGRQDVIEATVTFGENVVVSGRPELALLIGGQTRHATYRSGSGTTSLVFRYALTEGEADTVGISVPDGAISTAQGLVRYASTKGVAPARVVLGAQSGHLVDAVRPTLVSADASANSNDVTLTWDEALDEDSVPTRFGRGFTVRDTSAGTNRRITTIFVAGRVVTLTLYSDISATDQLRVDYRVPRSTHPPLKDTLGNYAGENNRATVFINRSANSPPEFPSREDGVRSVDENTPANRNIGTPVAATDADSDRLTYSISGADAALFDVVASSGQLRTKAALHHESRDSYSFTMSVHDGKDIYGNSYTTIDDTISVTVTVIDVDEPADISFSAAGGVTANNSALAVDENHDGSLAAFSASDPENKAGLTYTWSLGGSDQGDFAITDAGVLSFAAIPDFERPADSGGNNVYDITVRARDSDNMLGSVAVTVTVDAVNERPTIVGDAEASIEEGGRLLVGTYRAADPENALIAWQPLAGADGDRFEFTASNGRLVFKAAPDYEEATDIGGNNVYDVTLSVSAGGHTTTLDVAVSVTNKDEGVALPLGLSSPQPQAGADYTATLSDLDGLSSTDWTWERSMSRSGPWTAVSGAVDGVTTSVYRPVTGDVGYFLRVSAAYTDGHGPDKSRALVSANSVRAAPVANVAPSFEERAPTRRVAENARARAAVGMWVRATDTDSGDVVAYELSGSALFTINSNSGQISVVADGSLDHETAPSHRVTVKASDTSNAFDTVTVTIEVTDVNEPPDAVADTGRAREDGDVTIDVLANDSDQEDDRSALTLRVTADPRRGRATVKEPANPGERPTITYTPRVDYHGADVFTYEVSDAGSPYLASTATVTVTVDAVNDAPTFKSAATTRSVSESATGGGKVGAPVTATDVDDNDTLTYSLTGSEARFFAIGPRGQITVGDGVTFNIATKDTYTVTVAADDSDRDRAIVEVTITVTSGPTKPPITGGGGGGGGGGPPVVVEIDGPSFAAANTETVFTAAVSDDATIGSLSWTVTGPDGFTATSNAQRFSFVAPAGGAYTLSVTVDDTARRTLTGRVTLTVTLTVFGDITGHQFVNEILWLAEEGITRGCAAHSYCPSNPVTRAQMATFLARALELEAPPQPAGFDDVDPSSAHAANIEALHAAHITTGCTQDPAWPLRRLAYCPSNPVTRTQMATFLARALDLEAPPQPAGFADVDPSSAHAANIEALYAAQITTGCTQDPLAYCPSRPVTRAQMAAFLHRALKPVTNANSS